MFASRTEKIIESPTLKIVARVNELKAEGKDILSLSIGEPDFGTPEIICDAAIEAIQRQETKYTDVSGTRALRKAICQKLHKENHLSYTPDQVVCSNGGKQILYMTFQALLNEGDEVIVPSPFWVSYADQILLAGGVIREIDTSSTRFIPDPKKIEAAITPQTKAIVINSPSNPTGVVIPSEILQSIGEIACKYNLWIIADEVYEYFCYENEFISIAALHSDIADRTITVGSVSKSYAMTGWRLGYAVGPQSIITLLKTLQSHISSNPNSIAQAASIIAFSEGKNITQDMKQEYQNRRDYMYQTYENHGLFHPLYPTGAFYLWLDVSGCFNDMIKNSTDWCEYTLEKAHVACVPGSAFGSFGEKYVRISYASSLEILQEANKRIVSLYSSQP